MQQIKRHHFVPKTYLNAFCDESGKLLVYRKDKPLAPLNVTPDNTQFRRYYYSQPTPDGGQDNNTLESLFSTVESSWPDTVKTLSLRGDGNSRIENIYQFMALQRVRVPASRDMAEAIYAHQVKDTLKALLAEGKLPPLPPGLDDLPNKVEVTIDPHVSIHAMAAMLFGMEKFFKSLGFIVVHNMTKRTFITSDNPVIWFDPTLPYDEQKPYTTTPNGEVVFFFPVSPKIAICGSTEYVDGFKRSGFTHQETSDEEWVEMMNGQICRFAYEAVISNEPGQEEMVSEFKEVSPVHEAVSLKTETGSAVVHQHVFGKRVTKPKWRGGIAKSSDF